MPSIPAYDVYIKAMSAYNQFASLAMLAGILLALFFYAHKGKGLRLINLPLWAIVALGALLRIPPLSQNYWYDETFSSAVAQTATWGDFLTAVMGDVHPPLYYTLIRLSTQLFGHNDLIMRMPAFLSGLAMIVLMYHIGGRGSVGKWAALITALLPSTIYYSTEARYPMFLALMLGLAYLGIQRNNKALIAIGTSAAALSHVNAWFYVVALMLVYAWQAKSIKNVIRASLAPGIAMGSWFPVALLQAQDVSNGFWLQKLVPYMHLIEMTIGTRTQEIQTNLMVLPFGLALIFIAVIRWRKNTSWLWLGMVAGVPFMQFAVSELWHPIYLSRTLLFSALLLIVPLAWWLDRMAPRWLMVLGAISLLVAIVGVYLDDRDDIIWEGISLCADADTIYTSNTATAILARHYSDAQIVLWQYADSMAQELPTSAKLALFDGISSAPPQNACVLSQLTMFTPSHELAYLQLMPIFAEGDFKVLSHGESLHYVAVKK